MQVDIESKYRIVEDGEEVIMMVKDDIETKERPLMRLTPGAAEALSKILHAAALQVARAQLEREGA